jgi:tyrosyl-tRNA synthetase
VTDFLGTGFLGTLRERGFIQQTTDDETSDKPLEKLLASKRVTAYAGFDPTAPSLHVGNLVPVMGLLHLQRAGYRPIVLVGGGTGMVGDPSGKNEARRVLTREEIDFNVAAQKLQLARFIDLAPTADPGTSRGLLLNNADWLCSLNYIDFLRDIGRHFSVNRMLAAESVKLRLESESGLSFLELNYSLLQAYDFLYLSQQYDCELQLGGSDQWGNITAGTDLIRRVTGRRAHGITFPLVTRSDGQKMGKSVDGAIWIDAGRTSPYAYYQYWINTHDQDVGRFLRLFTLVPVADVAELEKLQGANLRAAKERLAYEATALCHGEEEAQKARAAAAALFGGGGSAAATAVPTHPVSRQSLELGLPAAQAFAESGLCESRSAARRMADQGGLYVNGEAVAEDRKLTLDDLRDGGILLRAGKKKHCRLVVA